MPIFAIAGIALSAGGMVSGAMGQQASTKAQYEQAKINQQWSEFEKQMSLTQQRGAMSLQEFDRLFGNAMLEKETLQQQVYGQRAYRDQSAFATSQLIRASRQAEAKQYSSMASRGAARGGTAEAIARQTETDLANDLARMRVNDEYQLASFSNQRNQMLKQRNMRPTNQPPTYIPATPVQSPATSFLMTGALLGALGQGFGGLAGMVNAQQSSSTPAVGAMSTNPNIPAAVSQYGNLGLGFTGG